MKKIIALGMVFLAVLALVSSRAQTSYPVSIQHDLGTLELINN